MVGVKYNAVKAAIEQLIQQDQRITVRAVAGILGGGGYGPIGQYIRQWRRQNEDHLEGCESPSGAVVVGNRYRKAADQQPCVSVIIDGQHLMLPLDEFYKLAQIDPESDEILIRKTGKNPVIKINLIPKSVEVELKPEDARFLINQAKMIGRIRALYERDELNRVANAMDNEDRNIDTDFGL